MSLEKRIEKRQMNQDALHNLLDSDIAPSDKVEAVKAYLRGEYIAETDADKLKAIM